MAGIAWSSAATTVRLVVRRQTFVTVVVGTGVRVPTQTTVRVYIITREIRTRIIVVMTIYFHVFKLVHVLLLHRYKHEIMKP